MAFCPVCNPGMTEDDDGDRYVSGPMVIDKETGEEVEDEDEREYLQDDGDICAKHTVYVSGNLDEGGQWGDCDLDSFLEKVREAFEANPESPTLAKALQAVPDWLSEPALDYAQREEGDDEPHEELYLSLIEHAEQETFGESYSIILSDKNAKSIFIPAGFAHGFCALDKENFVVYSCTNYRDKLSEIGIKYNDKLLDIKWPVKNPIISTKDKKNISFSEFIKSI